MAGGRSKQAIGLLTVAAVIFRAEIALLLICVSRYLLFTNSMTIRALVPTFLGCFVAALLVSVPLDSYFWQKPIWPELSGFIFNVVKGSSSEWGVSPWHYYFTYALPRLLLNPAAVPLLLFSLVWPSTTQMTRHLFIPSFMFVAVYSFQLHKEPRFIFYVVPPLTAIVAVGANYTWVRGSKSTVNKLLSRAVALSVVATTLASAGMLLISSLNYPGGDALSELQKLSANDARIVPVHADVLTCMTGLTLFGQNAGGLPLAHIDPAKSGSSFPDEKVLLFDKTEKSIRLEWPRFWRQFDYVLMENATQPLGAWDILGIVHGFDGVELLRPGQKPRTVGDLQAISGEARVLGVAKHLYALRDTVRDLTGGWWLGPRMAPRIRVMQRRMSKS